jgi:phosphoribosylformylglycinamidine synthase II
VILILRVTSINFKANFSPKMSESAFRIEIRPSIYDTRQDVFLKKIHQAGFTGLEKVEVTDVYTVRKDFSSEQRRHIADMLINPIVETATTDEANAPEVFDYAVEIGFLPGVTDNLGRTVVQSIEDLMKCEFELPDESVYSSRLLFLTGVSESEAQAIAGLFSNKLLNRIHVRSHEAFMSNGGMDMILPKVDLHHSVRADEVDLDIDDDSLLEIGKKGVPNADGTFRGPLALRMSYLKTIQDYFKKVGRKPRDIELEAIAQTWSEHCKHTIFADPLDEITDGIYKHYIRRATEDIRRQKGDKDFCVSVFKDNSGGIIFDENYVVTDKAETHNSPSALDPYGGAITGIVGVNRDALGYGKGAKPVINRFGYCFGDPETDPKLYRAENKSNPVLKPRTILDGVVMGVNHGGNESGIPTPQGFVYFDDRYNGKPLVFVGTVGLIPREINGKNASEKSAQAGDRIIVAGGRVGLDGIHGATFSSEALDSGSPSTAVQIGDPITQKKLSDVIVREARDAELYNSITDCGAGGISCSVAEMARECGGCTVELDRVPLKYPNLSPWEIWISESQERMTFAVPAEKVDEFMALLKRRGVEAADIGEFNDSGMCTVNYDGDTVFDLDMEFLHEGLPEEPQSSVYERPKNPEPEFDEPNDSNAILLQMLKRKNVASFKFITRQYDHEVQGGSVIKPVQGPGEVNGTAAVTRPVLDSEKAVVTSQGLNPRYSDIDTYKMAAASIDDAIAAAVAVGGNIDYMAIMDNFCWCSSDEPQRLGELKAAAEACYDFAVAYGTPYISGKDSMFNDFKGFDEAGNPVKISIPPTLLVSALSVIEDANKAVSMDFKREGDLLYLLGETKEELGGSEYFDMMGGLGNVVPVVDPIQAQGRYRAMHQAMQMDLFNSVIHLDRGGLGVALAKACIAGQLGAELHLSHLSTQLERNDFALFSESKSRFLVSVSPVRQAEFESKFPEAQAFGVVKGDTLSIKALDSTELVELPVSKLSEVYHSTFNDY